METTKKAVLINAIAELSKGAPNELLSILAQSLVPEEIAEIIATKKLDRGVLLEHLEKYTNSKNRENSVQIVFFQIFLTAMNTPSLYEQDERLKWNLIDRHLLDSNIDINIEKEIKETYLKKKAKLALEHKKKCIKELSQNSFDEFESVYKALA